jgi:hypothetical protein
MGTTAAAVTCREFETPEFVQEIEQAKKASQDGPVFLMEGGHKTHVLLSLDEYRKVSDKGLSIVDMLWDPAAAALDDIELPKREIQEFKNLDWD